MTEFSWAQTRLLFHAHARPALGLGVHQACFPVTGLTGEALEEAVARLEDLAPDLRSGVVWSDGTPRWALAPDSSRRIRVEEQGSDGLDPFLKEDRRRAATSAPGDGFLFTLVEGGDSQHLIFTFSRVLFSQGSAALLLSALAETLQSNDGSPSSLRLIRSNEAGGPASAEDQRGRLGETIRDRDLMTLDLPTPLPFDEGAGTEPPRFGHPLGCIVRCIEPGSFGVMEVDPVKAAASLSALWSVALRRITGRPEAVFFVEVEDKSTPHLVPPLLRTVVITEGDDQLTHSQLATNLEHQLSQPPIDIGLLRDTQVRKLDLPLAESVIAIEGSPLTWGTGPGAGSANSERSWMPEPVRLVLQMGGRPSLRLEYDRSRLADSSAERLLRGLLSLAAGRSEHETHRALDLPLLDETELVEVRNLARGEVSASAPDFLEGVHRWMRKAPETPALLTSTTSVTYGELERAVKGFAAGLRQRGLTEGSLVGIWAERKPEVMVAVLATLRLGAAYVPLDPAYPADRIAFMLEDSEARFIISSDRIGGEGVDWIPLPKLDTLLSQPIPEETEESTGLNPDALAYVIYTSGSTGRPKGVAMSRRPLSNLIDWQCHTSHMRAGDRTLQFASLSFDVSFQEIFSTLASGGTLVLIDERDRINPGAFIRFIDTHSVSRTFLPFVALQQLAGAAALEGLFPKSLREVFTAGEQLRITENIRDFFAALPGCFLENQYGPTESHVVTAHRLTGHPADWPTLPPIGRALPGTEVLISDRWGHPAPLGAIGEILIGGIALARGYLNRTELTQERFLEFRDEGDTNGARWYRSGDLGRMAADGSIHFIGRVDQQVKVRGFRIEPGEIESILEEHASVRSAVVLAREDCDVSNILVAYVQTSEGLDSSTLRRFAMERLPKHMVPSHFVHVLEFPLTPSGKIDRRTLARRDLRREQTKRLSGQADESIRTISEVWRHVLQVESIPPDTSFFELGGTSVLTLRLARELAEALGREVSVTSIFEYPTVAKFAGYLDDSKPAPFESSPHILSRPTSNGDSIAIIGLDCRLPGAADQDSFWRSLVDGVVGIRRFSREELLAAGSDPESLDDPAFVPARGMIDDADCFDAEFFGYSPREARLMDPQHRVFLQSCWKALESAGYRPDQMPGPTGVWGGMSTGLGFTTYLLSNVTAGNGIPHNERILITLGNANDYLTTRVSYKLNLRGPSINVQTACSTSMVAVCQAVASLRQGECDFALAGGVSISYPQIAGYLYQGGGIESPDGACRPFDSRARGTVFSDGVGVLVLRRLEDAIRDRDPIRAVIRGIGINNDGSDKISFSAPSVKGQANAIVAAQEDAGIPVESISYVEAHGTATELGDPIEILALTQAFRCDSQKDPFCAIGSVKSNIGHTVAAAGAAGIIKTVLAMENKYLPASLNFEEPNPRIDFKQSPFYVISKGKPWEGPHPRRAGVSSFGLGGTNAHLILEEAPDEVAAGAKDTVSVTDLESDRLLVLSAQSDEALEEMRSNLADHLEAHPNVELDDVAFTLQQGRAVLEHRIAIVARTREEALSGLRGVRHERLSKRRAGERPSLVFLFPGQGAQHVGMARDLYVREPVFREWIDRCADAVRDRLRLDLREFLADTGEPERLTATQVAQPALFAIEYALAQLWLSWGVKPTGMLGHSIGEYVAATLAGVFDFESALKLVVRRGELMQEQAPGGMVAVRAAADFVQSVVPDGVAVAAINSPRLCVISGPIDRIKEAVDLLEASGLGTRHLRTSHAFHSQMMDPVVEPFAQAVRQVTLQPPSHPFISSLTGTWIQDSEATDPFYWAQQIRKPVRFSPGIQELISESGRILLEVGPGQTLTTLARQHDLEGAGAMAVPSLPHPLDTMPDSTHLRVAVGRLWTGGVDLDWQTIDPTPRRRVPLPTYPFRRKPFRVDPPAGGVQTDAKSEGVKAPTSPAPADAVRVIPAQDRNGEGVRTDKATHDHVTLVKEQIEVIRKQLRALEGNR